MAVYFFFKLIQIDRKEKADKKTKPPVFLSRSSIDKKQQCGAVQSSPSSSTVLQYSEYLVVRLVPS